jgi:hypothetical protein
MPGATHNRRVFFSSIPKCGKNLIYSVLFGAGLQRYVFPDATFSRISHQVGFGAFAGRTSYAYDEPIGAVSDTGALHDFSSFLAQMPPDSVGHQHLLCDQIYLQALAENDIAALFISRDPRDALLSMLNYARTQNKPAHVANVLSEMSGDDAIELLLTGGEAFVPFGDYYDAYSAWLEAPGLLAVRFEDLIGQRGGGSVERQVETVSALFRHAGVAADAAKVAKAAGSAFNERAGTFFKGQVGAWRSAFSPRVERSFERHAGHLLDKWGYA